MIFHDALYIPHCLHFIDLRFYFEVKSLPECLKYIEIRKKSERDLFWFFKRICEPKRNYPQEQRYIHVSLALWVYFVQHRVLVFQFNFQGQTFGCQIYTCVSFWVSVSNQKLFTKNGTLRKQRPSTCLRTNKSFCFLHFLLRRKDS